MKYIYTITTVQYNKKKTKTQSGWTFIWAGWGCTEGEAVGQLHKYILHFWDNWAHYVVIEKVGQSGDTEECCWFKFVIPRPWKGTTEDLDKITLKKCAKPRGVKQTIGFCGIG